MRVVESRLSAGTRLVISHALAATAMSMPWPALLAAVWSRTHSDLWIGVTGALRMLPYVVLSAFSGMLADRVRRSTVVRWSTALRVALLAGSAVALQTEELVLAVVLAVLTVAVGTPTYPAAAAAMPSLAGNRSTQLTGFLVTAEVSGFVVGPALCGLLLGMGAERWAIPASAAITLLALVLLAGIRTGAIVAAAVIADRGRLMTVLRCRGVPLVIIVVSVVNLVISAASIGLLPLSETSWGTGERGFGIAAAALGFGSLAAPLLRAVLGLRSSLVATGAGLAIAGFAPGVVVAAAPLAVAGGAATVVECISTDVLQRAVPDHLRAFSLGLTDAAMVSAALLGALLPPVLISLTGPSASFLILGALLFLTAGLVQLLMWSASNAPQPAVNVTVE
jgi:MFS family permease